MWLGSDLYLAALPIMAWMKHNIMVTAIWLFLSSMPFSLLNAKNRYASRIFATKKNEFENWTPWNLSYTRKVSYLLRSKGKLCNCSVSLDVWSNLLSIVDFLMKKKNKKNMKPYISSMIKNIWGAACAQAQLWIMGADHYARAFASRMHW